MDNSDQSVAAKANSREAHIEPQVNIDHAFSWSRLVTYLALAILGAAADLWSKSFVFTWRGLPGQSSVWWVVKDYLGIQTAVNTGAVGGLGAGFGNWFAGLAVLAAVAIFVWLFWFGAAQSRWLTWRWE